MTNHVYSNLNGHDSGDVCGHSLTIRTDSYLPLREDSVHAGTIDAVTVSLISAHLRPLVKILVVDNKQLNIAHGYDHSLPLATSQKPGRCAPLFSPHQKASSLEIQITAQVLIFIPATDLMGTCKKTALFTSLKAGLHLRRVCQIALCGWPQPHMHA